MPISMPSGRRVTRPGPMAARVQADHATPGPPRHHYVRRPRAPRGRRRRGPRRGRSRALLGRPSRPRDSDRARRRMAARPRSTSTLRATTRRHGRHNLHLTLPPTCRRACVLASAPLEDSDPRVRVGQGDRRCARVPPISTRESSIISRPGPVPLSATDWRRSMGRKCTCVAYRKPREAQLTAWSRRSQGLWVCGQLSAPTTAQSRYVGTSRESPRLIIERAVILACEPPHGRRQSAGRPLGTQPNRSGMR
jgi:hypothetical protein